MRRMMIRIMASKMHIQSNNLQTTMKSCIPHKILSLSDVRKGTYMLILNSRPLAPKYSILHLYLQLNISHSLHRNLSLQVTHKKVAKIIMRDWDISYVLSQ